MMTINVIFVDTNRNTIEDFSSSSFLSDNDLSMLEKYKVEEVKKEKACSLILKKRYVGEYSIDEFGKPISEKICFNISHSKGAVIIALDNVPIGVDIEKIRPVGEDLINYISSKEEKEYIKDEKSFFEIWTNKESFTKAIGTGIKEKVSEIKSLPLNGVRKHKDKEYYTKVIQYQNYIISITRETNEPFEIKIEERTL